MRVPINQGTTSPPPQQGQQPSPEALLMAQAQLDSVQRAFRDKMTGTKDAPNQADIDKLDLGYATTNEAEGAVPWRDKLIDTNKLSPKHLKATGLK